MDKQNVKGLNLYTLCVVTKAEGNPYGAFKDAQMVDAHNYQRNNIPHAKDFINQCKFILKNVNPAAKFDQHKRFGEFLITVTELDSSHDYQVIVLEAALGFL